MTVTIEEFEADGLSKEELIKHWAWNNKSWQPGKFTLHDLAPVSLNQWWPLQDVHDFCLKLCAIYATAESVFPRELAEWLWTNWYRPGETPCRFLNFFARFVTLDRPKCPKRIPDLLDAHRRICSQVLLRQVVLSADDDKPKPLTVDSRADNLQENHENYMLEPTFLALFIVLDTKTPTYSRLLTRRDYDPDFLALTPALLVRTGDYCDLKTGPVDFAPICEVSEESDGNPDVRRIALGDAVDFILDLERQNGVER
ncbi:MAG: hypothetical protein Q9226_004829 [Calogaya cf. arnoldii]